MRTESVSIYWQLMFNYTDKQTNIPYHFVH